ncbi:hypothetical protein [Haloarchaeobius amylolyticus]|uniref:hypothetical protein n=1 Tax=Haloarchaeobius amylolyticus TaxID=1198296 RepID=UPI00226F8C2A|nr:hypothetical protein [Haloarchaeobius amylolyticus]
MRDPDAARRGYDGPTRPDNDAGPPAVTCSNDKELFGVFGDRDRFDANVGDRRFDEVLDGECVTVGVRSPGLGIPNRTSVADDETGVCAVWGEAFVPAGRSQTPAAWLLDAFAERGTDALADLNGSYLAVVEHDGEAIVATDPVRSWACYYTDEPGVRVFGTDATAVARTMVDPVRDRQAIGEFLHLGVVLGEKTAFEDLHRAPVDAYLTASDVTTLDRFVHEPREFDYVDELADRLERAMTRRSHYPGTKGMMLSAGYDSRLLLSQIPDIDVAFTVGHPQAQETQGARDLAHQYDTRHVAFEPSRRYIEPTDEKVQYSQGIKESLHIHHAGYDDEVGVDTMYHGLLCDTFLTGHFLKQDYVHGFGKRLPLPRLDPDPDPVEALLDKFGYVEGGSTALAEQVGIAADDPHGFVREAVGREVEKARARADDIQNVIDVAGISNQPSIPFRRHLFDNYLESFFVLDTALIDWHLSAPPEHRNTKTFLDACRQLDPDILENRPPDRPHDSHTLNQIELFARRTLPLLDPFESAWPDRRDIYERNDMDEHLFPNTQRLHDLPVRHKLRVNDVVDWTAMAAGTERRTPYWLVPPGTV